MAFPNNSTWGYINFVDNRAIKTNEKPLHVFNDNEVRLVVKLELYWYGWQLNTIIRNCDTYSDYNIIYCPYNLEEENNDPTPLLGDINEIMDKILDKYMDLLVELINSDEKYNNYVKQEYEKIKKHLSKMII
jgi:hypothetical protein